MICYLSNNIFTCINCIIMYDEEITAMLRRIDQKFVDICIHNKYKSRLEYIKAITEYIMDNRIDSGIVADCLDYLDIATD